MGKEGCMELIEMIGISAFIIFVYMTFMFLLAIIVKDNSIADTAWGIGFIVVGLSALLIEGDFALRKILVTALVLVWGLRLAIRIFMRNWGKGEDWRYRKWREDWGKYFIIRSYLQVFILQGFILLLNVSPVLVINTYGSGRLIWLDIIGILVWGLGFFFESVGDYQLDRFIENPENQGKIMDRGLWRYTRHPNYFGEVTMWWGIFIIALAVPWGWIGIIGPTTITLMIVFVSGIPLTEKHMDKNPAFADYKKKTSILIPWFPGR